MNTVIYATDEKLQENPIDILDFTKGVYEFLVNHVLKAGPIFQTVRPITQAMIKPYSLSVMNSPDSFEETFRTRTFGFNVLIGVEQGNRRPRLRIDINGSKINSTLKKLDVKTRNLMRNQILDAVYKSYRELS